MNPTAQTSQTKAINLLEAAFKLRQAGDLENALGPLEKAIDLSKDYVPAYVLLGLTHQELGNLEQAERAFREALAIDPEHAEALQSLGLLLVSAGRLDEAAIHLRKQLDLEPDDPTTLDTLTPALRKAGRSDEAEIILRQSWQKSHNEFVAVRLARFLLSQNRPEDASEFLEQVTEHHQHPRLFVELALALVIQEKYETAMEALERAVELREDYDRAWRGLAHCYTQLSRGKEAIQAAERALSINPHHYRNWQAKGDALLLLQRYDQALEAAQKGIDIILQNPEDEEAHPVLGVLFMQRFSAQLHMDMVGKALQGMEEARAQLPGDERFYYYPAQILAREEGIEPAEKLLQRGLESGALSQDEWLRGLHLIAHIGVELYLRGEVQKALDIFTRLVELAPQEPRFLNNFAYVCIGEGDFEAAEGPLKRVLEIGDPEMRAIALNDIGYVRLLQERLEETETYLEQALSEEEMGAFLRVAFWLNGQFIPDYLPHPSRSISTHLAARANLATQALARGNIEQATQLIDRILENAPSQPVGYELAGFLALAQGNRDKAKQAWGKAVEYAEDLEREAVAAWLAQLEG
jgi:tetratricopeptide (TPR) repeat protein